MIRSQKKITPARAEENHLCSHHCWVNFPAAVRAAALVPGCEVDGDEDDEEDEAEDAVGAEDHHRALGLDQDPAQDGAAELAEAVVQALQDYQQSFCNDNPFFRLNL